MTRGDEEHILGEMLRTDNYNRKKEERTTENTVERRMATIFEKYGTESGRGDGQGDAE